MTHKDLKRIIALLGALMVSGGCSSSTEQVEFVNASDTWLNVRVFVADPGPTSTMTMADAMSSATGPASFLSEARHRVEPGAALRYDLSWNPNFAQQPTPLVHVMVEPVTPSWMPAARKYWLELLTPPPLMIVATGNGEELKFNSGGGTVAMIPEEHIREERFEHKVVSAPEVTQ